MKFLLAGDSWGCGEWPRQDLRKPSINDVKHGGLGQYLAENGHTVQNLSQGGASNTFIQLALTNYLEIATLRNTKIPDKIIVFQTSYTRDYRFRFEEDWGNITEANTLAHIWISRFYSRLSDISKLYKIPIYIVGGVSDTVWIDNMEQYYPGVSVVCQSMVNLIVDNNHRVDQPVFSWYSKEDFAFLTELKSKLPSDKLNDFLDCLDQGTQRQNLVNLHPEYFFPDGVHPNRLGHEILYNFLKEIQVV